MVSNAKKRKNKVINHVEILDNLPNNLQDNLQDNLPNNLLNNIEDNINIDWKLIYDEDDIRPPKPTYEDKIIGDGYEDFEKFIQQIMSDNSYDDSMKQIIIQSRKEFIDNFDNKIKLSSEKAIRSGIIVPLIIRLKDESLNSLTEQQKQFLLNQIDKWIDGLVQFIELESELLYLTFELVEQIEQIEQLSNENRIVNVNVIKIKNVFVPKNYEEYLELADMMEIVKTQSIIEEQQRINKENVIRKEEQEKIELMKKQRELNLAGLYFNFNKMCSIDQTTRLVKDKLQHSLSNYKNLQTDLIELDSEQVEQLIKFIGSIRISKDDKEKIINLIKQI